MNTALVTGYLPKQAWDSYRPGGARIVGFDVVLKDEASAEESVWSCEIDDAAEIARVGNLLLAGRGVALRGRLAGRPFVKNGVSSGYVRFLRIDRVEFVKSDRSQVQMERDEPEAGP